MMAFKLLHAADLHLGQRFHDHDRSDDEEHALAQIVCLAQDELVDVVILAGDIFDVAHPGAREAERYNRFLGRLVCEAGVGTVVVIAGNHDNYARIEGPRELLKIAHVHTRGAWRLQDPPDDCHVTLIGRTGRLVGRLLAVPFLHEADVRLRAPGETADEAAAAHIEAVRKRLEVLHASVATDLPLVVVAHAYATGGTFGGGERAVQIGNLAHIPADGIAGVAAYLALGHLHRPQIVAGRDHWRYSGSILPTGFDELDISRQVVVAGVHDSGPAQVRPIDLKPYRRYERLTGTPLQLEEQIQDLLPPDDGAPTPWLRAYVNLQTPEPGLGQRLGNIAQGRGWHLLGVECQFDKLAHNSNGQAPAINTTDLDLTDAGAVFDRLVASSNYDENAANDLRTSFARLIEKCDTLLEEDS
jgi:exonuclease SbcD